MPTTIRSITGTTTFKRSLVKMPSAVRKREPVKESIGIMQNNNKYALVDDLLMERELLHFWHLKLNGFKIVRLSINPIFTLHSGHFIPDLAQQLNYLNR